jgi:hypothetical protein
MQEIHCKNWTGLISKIKEAKEKLGNPKTVWYRGQSNSSYKLIPSLLRQKEGLEKEKEIFSFFKQVSSRFTTNSNTDWELLFSMQHYWIPTRLLDWSEVVGIPLFFASKFNETLEGNEAISLYVLDPIRLNLKSQKNYIPHLPGQADFEYQKIYFNKEPFAPNFPIAISPNYNHNRLLAQKGVFTIHPDSNKSIEELCPDCGVKIIIAKQAIPEILEILELTNINEMSIFPDLQGAAEYIKTIFLKR